MLSSSFMKSSRTAMLPWIVARCILVLVTMTILFKGVESFCEATPPCDPGDHFDGTGCSPCPRGTYQPENCVFGATCLNCTGGATTVDTGSDSSADCVCPGGTFTNDTGGCEDCPIGTYNNLENQTSCNNCSALGEGLTTEDTGNMGSDTCVCGPGYASNTGIPTCTLCEDNSIKPNIDGECVMCNGSSVANDEKTACVCPGGTFMNETGGCEDCPVGTFNFLQNQTSCTNCSDAAIDLGRTGVGLTTEDTGNIISDDCVCGPGYETFWIPECVRCQNNSVNPIPNGDCDMCNGTSLANDERTACVCPAGNYMNELNNGICEECAKGTYSNAEDQTSCRNCSEFGEGLTTEDTGSTQDSMCVCPGGTFTNDTGGCEDCPIGTYSNLENQTSCNNCSALGEGLTTEDTGNMGSDMCVCGPGYASNTGIPTCTLCEDNSIKPNIDGECVMCNGSSVANDEKTACVEPSSSDVEPSSTEMEPATTGDETATTGNEPATSDVEPTTTEVAPVTSGDGSATTQVEPATTGAEMDSSSQTIAPTQTTDSVEPTMSATECEAGEFLGGDGCSPCAPGFYKSQPGNGNCEECPTNTDTNGQSGSTSCMCAPGTEGDGVTCIECVLSYQPGGVAGNVTCTICPPDTNAPNKATAASACTAPESTTAVSGSFTIVNVEFVDCQDADYENIGSESYNRLANSLTIELLAVFDDSTGVINILFKCGSIEVSYDLLFGTADVPTSDQLSETLQESLNNGFLGTDYQVDTDSITFEDTGSSDNTWVFILVGGIGLIIVAIVTVLFVYKVCPQYLQGGPSHEARHYYDVRRSLRPQLAASHQYEKPSAFRTSAYSSPYYKYGY